MGCRKLTYYQAPELPELKAVGLKYELTLKYTIQKARREQLDEIKGSGNSLDFGARIYDSRLGRWLSVDPLAAKYPFASPYNFTLNNPILFIDPDGREVTISGTDVEETKTKLQTVTSLKLSIDKNGKLKAELPEGSSIFKSIAGLSKLDAALFKAINDKTVNVNLETTQNNFAIVDGKKLPLDVGGFLGSDVKNGKVEAKQLFNINQAKQEEKEGGNDVGTNAAHEIIESFIGGKESPGAKIPVSKNATQTDVKAFTNAHEKAAAVDPNFKELVGKITITSNGRTKDHKVFSRKK